MNNMLIHLDSFSSPPHAAHLLVTKDKEKQVIIHLIDSSYNNQGSMTLTDSQAGLLISELTEVLGNTSSNSLLLQEVEKIAEEKYDGHYTIFKFTTHYKGCFGTAGKVDYEDYRHFISCLPAFKTLDELLQAMVRGEAEMNEHMEVPERGDKEPPFALTSFLKSIGFTQTRQSDKRDTFEMQYYHAFWDKEVRVEAVIHYEGGYTKFSGTSFHRLIVTAHDDAKAHMIFSGLIPTTHYTARFLFTSIMPTEDVLSDTLPF